MKIALIGTHWVGKSTTLEALSIEPQIKEVARQLLSEWYEQWTEEFQRAVLKKQIQAENAHSKFITDRSVWDNLAYTRYISEDLYQELLPIARQQKYDLLFFIPIQFPIQDDWLRPQDEQFQKDIQDILLKILKEEWLRYYEVMGYLDERVSYIREVLCGKLWNRF